MRRTAESDAEGSDVEREGDPKKSKRREKMREASDPEPVSAYQRRIKLASAGNHPVRASASAY